MRCEHTLVKHRTVFMGLLGLLLLVAVPSTALGQVSEIPEAPGAASASDWADKTDVFGLGANVNLGRSAGLIFRAFISNTVGVHGNFALRYDSVGGGDEFSIETGLYTSIKVVPFDVGHISMLFGADFLFKSNGEANAGNDVGVLATVGLMGEWFVLRHFSLYGTAGMKLGVVESGGDGFDFIADSSDGTSFGLGAGLMAQAGFTVWFE